ncbi:glycosyl transferase [Nitratireductor mangrovi]|uniref:Glycosyl transferase n=1 Tax=Nitratireductor mangrovi TaxID=2599600 RepID=A0A5B8L428_9HYPH|nr:glycosyltransferase [Nitratireductor mangrovi]QDZ02675.1 glycosyl transferase [Nitratireductor mangrovi]
MRRVLFYVQHLMGVGHVFRAARIIRALVAAGFEVDFAFGGIPIPNYDGGGARIHYLPPVRAGEEVFNRLELPDGTLVDDAWKDQRRDMLLEIFERVSPDIIITEAFPFGRRQMRFELLPLMEAARNRTPRPLIVGSVRDIIQRNTTKPERDREVVELIQRYFDRILIHGDPALTRLEDTFPHATDIADRIAYTGIVAPPVPAEIAERSGVVVSVGGGALGYRLLKAAVASKPLSTLRDERWTVITGLRSTAEQRQELSESASGDLRFLTFVDDLPALLAGTRLSISRAGYNTAADIYVSGCRAVVSPLSDGTETEQIERTELMARHQLAEVIPPGSETPEAYAAAIDRALKGPAPDRSRLRLDGAAETARLLRLLADGHVRTASA